MAYDSSYLGQNLNERTRKATNDFAVEINQIDGMMAKNGVLNSSMTFQQYWQAGLRVLEREANEACRFVYNLTGQHTGDPYDQVEYCVGRMVENIMQAASEKVSNLSSLGGSYGDIVNRMRSEMIAKRDNLLADFKNGMMGSERLKRDPVVSVVANQTNSPGAIQQVGVGDFSQKALLENHQPLINAVDKALTSLEYQQLQPQQKEGFKDVADALLDEAKKDKPDPGKLKRWGQRLVDLGKELGLHVVAAEIAHVVASIFPG